MIFNPPQEIALNDGCAHLSAIGPQVDCMAPLVGRNGFQGNTFTMHINQTNMVDGGLLNVARNV